MDDTIVVTQGPRDDVRQEKKTMRLRIPIIPQEDRPTVILQFPDLHRACYGFTRGLFGRRHRTELEKF